MKYFFLLSWMIGSVWGQDRLYKAHLNLQKIKTDLILGNVGHAKKLIREMILGDRPLGIIQKRYLALAASIEGNYLQSQNIINSTPQFQKLEHLPHICLLKINNSLILNDLSDDELLIYWSRCRGLTLDEHGDGISWINFLVKNETQGQRPFSLDVRNLFFSGNPALVTQALVSLLYHEQSKLVFNLLKRFPDESLQKKSFQELIALHARRGGQSELMERMLKENFTSNALGLIRRPSHPREKTRGRRSALYEVA